MHRRGYLGLGVLLAAMGGFALMGGPASATVTDVESSTITPAACWANLSGANYQGGSTRHCVTAAQPISWTVTIPPGEEGTVEVFGLLDSSARVGRIRVDGGTWASTTTTAAALTYKVLVHTSPTLAAGAHTFDYEYVSGGNVHFDFYRVTTAPETTTTTTLPATTTTLPPTTTTLPATTTTTLPPTTTTTEAPGPTTTLGAGAPYEPTQTDYELFGAVVGVAAGCIAGGVIFTNTWRDDQP